MGTLVGDGARRCHACLANSSDRAKFALKCAADIRFATVSLAAWPIRAARSRSASNRSA